MSNRYTDILSEIQELKKVAFTPMAPPPGAPPMDPAMAGGIPPMDPAMMGGAMPPPPMDPAMAGGMPPGPPPVDPATGQPMDPAMAGGPAPDPLMEVVTAMEQIAETVAGQQEESKQMQIELQEVKQEYADIKARVDMLLQILGKPGDASGL